MQTAPPPPLKRTLIGNGRALFFYFIPNKPSITSPITDNLWTIRTFIHFSAIFESPLSIIAQKLVRIFVQISQNSVFVLEIVPHKIYNGLGKKYAQISTERKISI